MFCLSLSPISQGLMAPKSKMKWPALTVRLTTVFWDPPSFSACVIRHLCTPLSRPSGSIDASCMLSTLSPTCKYINKRCVKSAIFHRYSRFLDVILGGCFGHSQDVIVIHHVASCQSSPLRPWQKNSFLLNAEYTWLWLDTRIFAFIRFPSATITSLYV